MTTAKVAINGFGRIGRLFFRQADELLDIVAVNDLADPTALAYLLQYDSLYRVFERSVTAVEEGGLWFLVVNGKKIRLLRESDPTKLPWKDLQVDVVVEATGIFESFEKARAHLAAGAKRVVITAPVKDEEQNDAKTVLLGVNEEQFKTCLITSNGSCTTNAAHPVAAIMAETVGVKKAFLTTAHGYTAMQSLVDGPPPGHGSDFRRGRAAGVNIVPTTSGVAVSVTRAVPALAGKFDGLALRVPVAAGSIADFTFLAGRPTSVEEVNGIFKQAAQNPRWKETMAVIEDPIVSSDVIGLPYGAIIDLSLTKVVDGDLVKVLSWYDNEWGYVSTLLKHVQKVIETL